MVRFAERLANGGARKLLTGDDGQWVTCPVCLDSMGDKEAFIFGCGHHECVACHGNRVSHARMTSINPKVQCASCRADIDDDIFRFECKTTNAGKARRTAILIDIDVKFIVVSSDSEDDGTQASRPKRKRRKRIADLALVCAALASSDDDGSETDPGSDTEWHKTCRRRACTGDKHATQRARRRRQLRD